jgi:hypothetical protein
MARRTNLSRRTRLSLAVAASLALGASATWADPVIGSNILVNPGFESNDHATSPPPAGYPGWVLLGGNWERKSSGPAPAEGSYYYFAGACATAAIYQDRDLLALGYDSFRLDTGGYYVDYGGDQYTYNSWPYYDGGMIGVDQFNRYGGATGSSNLGWQYPLSWTESHGSVRLNPGTTRVRYGFVASRAAYTNNDAYLDGAYVKVQEYSIWTWGDNTASYAGAGPWNTGTAEVRLGSYATGGIAVTNGATLTTGGPVGLGYNPGSSGTARLAGGTWNTVANGSVTVGFGGAGSVIIDAGGIWNTTTPVYVATSQGRAVPFSSSGFVSINPGGRWTSSGDVYVSSCFAGASVSLNGGSWEAIGPVKLGVLGELGILGQGVVNVNPGGQWTGSGPVYLGSDYNTSGTVNLNGGTWDSDGGFYVGYGGSGAVNVKTGSQWTGSAAVVLGELSDAAGTVNLDGGTWSTTGPVYIAKSANTTGTINLNGGTWNPTGSVYVGYNGAGVVNVNPGNQWTGRPFIGWYLGSTGTVNLNGANWSLNGVVGVGKAGSGEINVNGGSQWVSSEAVILGTEAGSQGVVNLKDGGTWTSPAWVGQHGYGEVNIGAGSQWTSGDSSSLYGSVILGRYPDGKGVVNLNGGSWTNSDKMSVGGALPFTGGVGPDGWHILIWVPGGSGEVNVGANSVWTTNLAGVGLSGPGTVNLTGGTWNAKDVRIGGIAKGEVNVGVASQWNTASSGEVTVGWVGNSSVNLTGGTWNSAGAVTVGPDIPGYAGTVNVGSGSQWTADGPVRIGTLRGNGAVNITGGTMAIAGQNLTLGVLGKLNLDGGRLNIHGDAALPTDGRFALRGGTLQVDGKLNWPSVCTLSAGSNIILSGASARWEPASLTVAEGASLTIDGATLHLTPGSVANFSSPLIFGAQGGKIELDHAQLIHAAYPLALADAQITGVGQIVVGSAGIALGLAGHPGTIAGASSNDRLVIYGDVFGFGAVSNTTIYGNLDAAQMTLTNVIFGGNTVAMDIGGTQSGQFDQLAIGKGVSFGSSTIDLAFSPGFTPNPANTFQVFTARKGGSLNAALASAIIQTPAGWSLDRSSGVLRSAVSVAAVAQDAIWTWGDCTPSYSGPGPWIIDTLDIGITADGALHITNGATVSVFDLHGVWIGGSGHGTVNIDGGTLKMPLEDSESGLGVRPGSKGIVNLNNGIWNVSGSGWLEVGINGEGEVNAGPGSQWTIAGYERLYLGVGQGGKGTVNLAGATLTTGSDVEIGDKGYGEVTLGGGAQWTAASGPILGLDATGVGVINISDGGRLVAPGLYAGIAGTGRITVDTGGVLETNSYVLLGNSGDGQGIVNLTGGQWTAKGPITIGNSGTGAVNISGGVLTTEKDVIFGQAAGAHGGQGVVNLTGGQWTAKGPITIGNSGTGAVNISGGSLTTDQNVAFGQAAGAQGVLNLASGQWGAKGIVWVGYYGTGAINITGGSLTTERAIILGQDPGAQGVVNLAGGQWTANGIVGVGNFGTGKVTMGAGGILTTVQEVILGYASVSQGVVDLTGGQWTANGKVQIGKDGTGAVNITGGAMTVDSANLAFGSLGTLTLEGGQLNLHGDFTAPSGFVFRSGTLQLTDGELAWTPGDGSGPRYVVLVNATWQASDRVYRDGSYGFMDGGEWDVHGNLAFPATIDFRSGTIHVTDGRLTGLPTLGSGQNVVLTHARLETASQTVGNGASVTLDGSQLVVTHGGFANFTSPLTFGPEGGEVQLDHARLIHAAAPLALLGNLITGSGEVIVGSAGINLGSTGHPGTLAGTSDVDRLLVYGDIRGSGSLEQVTIFGDVTVGNSAGLMMLENVLFDSGSTFAMEIAGTDPTQFDQVILGPGVDFGMCPLRITFAPGFTPNIGDTFQLFTAQPGVGLFGSLGPAGIDVPTNWNLDRTTGQMSVVPEPNGMIWLVLAALPLMRRKERRGREYVAHPRPLEAVKQGP